MKVIVDGQVYDYNETKMLNTEAIALQKVTGMRIPEWAKALQEGDAYAMTALVWLIWRREGRDVAFDDVEFDIGALDMEDEPEPEPEVGPTEPPPVVAEVDPT